VIVASPSTVRQAAVATALEGVALLVVAVVLLVRAVGGAQERSISGYGTAGWFVVMGGGVLAAGWALWTGRRWGRGIAVFAQLLLLGVAWYVAVGSQQWAYGVPVALIAVLTLVLLFSPSALQWIAQDAVEPSDTVGPPDSASADRSEPDTR
jgi:peptidoglycan/LPS O-acetylase OafA/YrhL